MRVLTSKEYNYYLFRFFSDWPHGGEVAYVTLGITGLEATIEFPSDWHEEARAWIRLGFGFGKLAISFPWKTVVPDEHQCSGPRYGFHFFEDLLWINYGKCKGMKSDPKKTFYMPWAWKHREHNILTEPESHPYTYTLKNGTVQLRTATIQVETRLWTRFWLPYRRFQKTIDVEFSDEVGERTGSWKGGTVGCGYEMKSGETPLQTLRRMEIERKF